ncbi:MAG: insulinase family protein [Deltaproteobacteria bacterium]|nr:insulinase family protein [Deltaproteobacteria bacterium]
MASSGLSPKLASGSAEYFYTLPNGLKVILAPQPDKPVISARVMVKTGSAAEVGIKEQGLAHLMEHMAFKGTAKRKVGEISSLVETNGGAINAYTSYDETVYYLALPSEKLELGLDILADLVFYPTYDPDEYTREKEVVLEEIRRSEDSPDSVLFNLFFTQLFSEKHPYGHRVLGLADSVKNASRDTAFNFHNKYYRPDNCVLIVTGGLNIDEAKAFVLKYFGDIKNPKTTLAEIPIQLPPNDGPKVLVIKHKDATLPKVFLGFRAPSARGSETPLYGLLGSILSSGDSSRIQENVRFKKGLVSSIYGGEELFLRAGAFLFNYETTPEKVVPAFEAIIAELNGLANPLISESELSRSRALAAKNFVDRQETPLVLGGVISGFELLNGDFRLKDTYLNTWGRAGSRDIYQVAREIFRPENMVVYVMLPEDSPDIATDALVNLAKTLNLPELPADSASQKATFEAHVLPNGIRLLVLRDTTLPLVEMRLGILGGRLAEKPGQEGLTQLLTEIWDMASTSRNNFEMARAIEDLGISIEGYGTNNSFGLSASYLNSSWREGLKLFCELLTSPAFAEEDFQQQQRELLAYIKTLDENLSDRVFRLIRKELFRDHPYNTSAIGTYKSMEGLTRADVVNLYSELVYPENIVIAVAGDIDPQEFIAALQENLAAWKPQGNFRKITVPNPPPPLGGAVKGSEALDRAQSHLALSFLSPGFGEKDQAALDVFNYILSGMGGVLFQELREKQSLAYSVASAYGPGAKTGSFIFYIGSAPEKIGTALHGILAIIEQSKKEPFAPEVVEGAKTYLAGINKIQRQSLGSLVREAVSLDLFGVGQDFNDRYLEAILQITPQDVQAVAQKYLVITESALAVVGQEESITAALEQF